MKKLLPLSIVSLIVWSSCCYTGHYSSCASGSHSNSSFGITRGEQQAYDASSSKPSQTAIVMSPESAVSAAQLAITFGLKTPTTDATSNRARLAAIAQSDPDGAATFADQHSLDTFGATQKQEEAAPSPASSKNTLRCRKPATQESKDSSYEYDYSYEYEDSSEQPKTSIIARFMRCCLGPLFK